MAAQTIPAHIYHDPFSSYTKPMVRRTTIEIDDALLAQAQSALGTNGLKDTVDAALLEAVRSHLRRSLADRLETGEGIDRSLSLLAETRPER